MSHKRRRSPALPATFAEWVSLSISLLLLAGVVAVIITMWLSKSGGPPLFRVERGAAFNDGRVFHLPITVINYGDSAASQVRVEGRLSADGGEDRPATTIDFLPVRAREEVVLMFRSEPSSAAVEVVSYQKP